MKPRAGPPETGCIAALGSAALDALPYGIWIYDPAERLAYVNAAALDQTGLRPEAAAPGTPLPDMVRLLAYRGVYGSGDPAAQAELHLRLDRSRPLRRLLRRADGRTHELRSFPLPGGGFCSVVRDMTEQAEAAEEAARRARRLELVLSHLHGGVALYDQERRLQFHNARYEGLLGLPLGALRPGMDQEDVWRLLADLGEFANADPEAVLADRRRIDRGQPGSYQRERPNGTVIRFESQPVPAAGGYLVELTEITALKRAEDEARRRAALIDGVLVALPHGVVVFDHAHRVSVVNDAYLRIMADAPLAIGEHREAIARRRIAAGEYGPGDPAALMRVNLPDPVTPGLRRVRTRPNGTVLDIRYAPLPDGGFVQVTTDITALHQAEAEARGRARIMQVLLDNLRHGIAMFDAAHRLTVSNALAARLLGVPPESMVPGRSFEAIVADQVAAGEFDQAFAAEYLERVGRAGGRGAALSYTRRRPDGTILEVISDPTPDGGFVATYSDVTARATAEAEARERAETLQNTIDNLRHGIIVYGADRRVKAANRLASVISGHAPGAIRPGRLLDELARELIASGAVSPGPDGEATVAHILRYDRSRPHTSVRTVPDGRVIEVHSDPLPDGGFIVSHVDITRVALAEAEARSRAAMLQAMLDNMRHGIALYGPDQRLLAANALAASLCWLAPEDMVPGRPMAELVDIQRARGAFGAEAAEAIKALDRSRHQSGRRGLPDGRVIEIASDPTPDGGFVISWSDITARASAEEAARSRAAVLQATLDNVRHGIAMYGPDRRLVTANRLAGPGYGLPPLESRVGQRFEELVEEQRRQGAFGEGEAARRIAAEVLALDRRRTLRYQRRLPNGRVIEVGSDPTPDGGFVITHSDVTGLVEAQAEATRRAAVLQAMLDNMRHGIALFDAGDRVVAANGLAAALTGLGDVQDMVGRSMDELMDRQLAEGEIRPDFRAAARRVDRSRPHRFLRERPDGTVLEITSDPAPEGGYVVTYRDVTELTRLEAEARRRADILQVMLDNIRHGICFYGPDRRVIAANALAADLGGHLPGFLVPGRSLEELIAQQIDQGSVGGDAQAVAARALQMDRSRPHRYVRPHRDGRIVEVTSDPTPGGGFVVTMSDISALAEAEAEAQRRAAIQQVMLDNIRHGIMLVDRDGMVVAANAVLRDLLGLPPELVAPGRGFTEFVDWLEARGDYGEGEAGAAAAAAIRSRDRSHPVRTVRARPDGTVLEAVSDPTPDGGFVLTFTDLTEERRVQAELERARDAAESANRAKSRFLATMSHELRTPLNAVIGFSKELTGDLPPDLAKEFAGSILEAGRHLLSLIDDILDVTRAETTGFQVAEGEVDVATLAEAALRVSGANASAAGVTMVAELPEGLPKLRADELRLRQVLLNLLSNAVKFTPSGGRVTLSVALEAEAGAAPWLVLRITDTGIGMRPEDIPRAFEAFTQLEETLSRRFAGSGLGLYLSRALAAAQGAELTLESMPGSGTTAVLRFPPERLILQPARPPARHR